MDDRAIRAELVRLAQTMPDRDRFHMARLLLSGARFGNIRDMGVFLDSLVDLSPFNACFPGSVVPTDVDGAVECKGKGFLWLEHKLPEDTGLDAGQFRFYKALASRGDTVIIWASRSHDLSGTTWMRVYGPGYDGAKIDADGAAVLRVATEWWERTANGEAA
jgi:hypothetical protein